MASEAELLAPVEQWRDIGTADGSDCIVGDGIAWAAVAYRRGGEWYLGHSTDEQLTDLEFMPTHWLPSDIPTNPFRASFPDGRPTMWERATAVRAATMGGSDE